MNGQEAAKLLDDNGEHKFLFDTQSPVWVMQKAREQESHPLLHEELAEKMVQNRLFPDLNTVLGGYCRVVNEKLRYWGESSYPIRAASEKQFHLAVDTQGIEFIPL